MKLKRTIGIFMMLIVCITTCASLPDTLLSISKAYEYNYTKLDKSLDIIHTIRERGEEPAWKLLYAEGDLYRNTCHYHDALKCFQEAFKLSDVQSDVKLQMKFWRAMVNCHDMLMDDILLMDDLYHLRSCASACDDEGHKAIAYFVLGKRYHLHGEKEKGYLVCLDALESLKKSNVSRKLFSLRTCYSVLVKLYRVDRRFDKAMQMSRQQEKYVRMTGPDDIPGERNINLHNVYGQRASLLAEAGRLAEADEAYQLWKETLPGNPYDNREVLSYLLIANRFDEALTVVGRYKDFLNAEGDSINIRMLDVLTYESQTYSLLNDYERAVQNNGPMASIAYQLHQQTSRKEMEARYHSLQEHDRLHRRYMWALVLLLTVLGALVVYGIYLWYHHKASQHSLSMQRVVNRLSAYQKAAFVADEALGVQTQTTPVGDVVPSVEPATKPVANTTPSTEQPPADKAVEDELLFVELDKRVTRDQLFLNPNLSREDLMRVIGVDKNRIGRIMSRYSDASNISTYINQKRASYAASYIKLHPDYTLAAVMEACGMSNTVTLNRAFKDLFGMSPSEYRRQVLAGKMDGGKE